MADKKAGRKKGVPNKASKSLREALQALRFDLPSEFIKLYNTADLDAGAKLRLLTTLLEYTHPRLKEQEIAEDDETPTDTPATNAPTADLLSIARQKPTA